MKKTSLQKLSFLAVLLLFCGLLTMCTPAGNTTSAKSEAELIAQLANSSTVQLYWNVDRLNYLTGGTCDTSTRPQGSDGKYTIPFAVNGSQVNLKVASADLLNVIDFNDVVGLVVNAQGEIQEVKTVSECTGDYAAYRSYVTAVVGNTVSCNTAAANKGVDFTLTLTDTTGIYDVTKADASCGSTATLTAGDQIIAIRDVAGNITHVYITKSFDMDHAHHCVCCGNAPIAQAQHTCDATQNDWIPLTETTITNPNAVSGKYYLTGPITMDTTIKVNGSLTICLNGFELTCRNIRFSGSGEANAAAKHTVTICDCSADKTGALTGTVKQLFFANKASVAVAPVTINIWGGTLRDTAADGTLGHIFTLGGANSKNHTLNIYGGTIIGGNCPGSSGTAAQGGVMRLSAGAKANIYGGTIKDGAVNTNGSNIAYGGNIYITGSSSALNIYGGTIEGGKCSDPANGGNIYAASGTTVNFEGGTIISGQDGNTIVHGTKKISLSISKMALEIKGEDISVGVGYTTEVNVTGFTLSNYADTGNTAVGVKLYKESATPTYVYQGKTAAVAGSTTTFKGRITGIMKQTATGGATTPIHGAAYVVIGKTVVESQEEAFTLQQVVERLDAGSVGLNILADLYKVEAYKPVMTDWTIPNTKERAGV